MKKKIPIVFRNTAAPSKKSGVFTTYNNNQTDVSIKISEGEKSKTNFDNLNWVINFSGISPRPRCVARIEITIDINSSCDVKFLGRDKSTGISNSTIIDVDNIWSPIDNSEIIIFDAITALENLSNTTHEVILEEYFF